jgi:hypothetical protein
LADQGRVLEGVAGKPFFFTSSLWSLYFCNCNVMSKLRPIIDEETGLKSSEEESGCPQYIGRFFAIEVSFIEVFVKTHKEKSHRSLALKSLISCCNSTDVYFIESFFSAPDHLN